MVGLTIALDGDHRLTLAVAALQRTKLLFHLGAAVTQVLALRGQVGNLSKLLIAQALEIGQPLFGDNQRLPSLVGSNGMLMNLRFPSGLPIAQVIL
ncbi:hypothetical protein SB85_02390 [Xanthomonas sacchari]|nr:hypothetical protein SB85_02390 [Xanthomonas sacchari]